MDQSGKLVKSYKYNDDDLASCSTISLYDNDEFIFVFSLISSYIGYGKYVIEDGRLILRIHDGDIQYEFDIVEDTLIFDSDTLADMLVDCDIVDGSEFE